MVDRWRNRNQNKKPDFDRPDMWKVYEYYTDTTAVECEGWTKVSCLFHEDNNPSASINNQKQWFHCFSCGFSGDSYRVIMEKEGVDFVGAVEWAEENIGHTSMGSSHKSDKRPVRGRLSILDRD